MYVCRRTGEGLVGRGLFIQLATGSMPSEEEMAEAEDQAFWTEKKGHVRWRSQRRGLGGPRLDEGQILTPTPSAPSARPSLWTAPSRLGHATLDFLVRLRRPAALTADKHDFYRVTDMVTFTRMDELPADGRTGSPRGSAGNIAPVCSQRGRHRLERAHGDRLRGRTRDRRDSRPGLVPSREQRGIEWVEGAIFSGGVSPLAGKPLALDISYWN